MIIDAENCRKIYNAYIENNAGDACTGVKIVLERIKLALSIEPEHEFDIKVILCELLQNAIQHGNECDCDKKIHLSVWLHEKSGTLEIEVTDEGCGFDPLSASKIDCDQISCDDPMNICESGRGLFIVNNLCDFMEINNKRNGIIVRKKLCTL